MAATAFIVLLPFSFVTAPECTAEKWLLPVAAIDQKPDPTPATSFIEPTEIRPFTADPSQRTAISQRKPARNTRAPIPVWPIRKKDSECRYEKGTLE